MEQLFLSSSPSETPRVVIGVVDTMFARYNMGKAALDELSSYKDYGKTFTVLRQTVPGFKDLAVAAKRMIEIYHAAIVVVCGMPGSANIDKQCAHEASQGIMQAQLMTSTHILEVFVHEDETKDPATLVALFEQRTRDHARNAYWLLFEPQQLVNRAGQGIRQGFHNATPLLKEIK